MKKLVAFCLLLITPAMLSAQSGAVNLEDQRAEKDTRSIDSISVARSQYTETSDISLDASNPTLAQLGRGGPGRPLPPQRGYSRGTYPTPWMDHGNIGHIFVGAAIGFSVGAALGADRSARNGTPVSGGIVIGGALFGLLGGCVGKAVGDLQGLHYWSAHRKRTYRPSWPEHDEQSDRSSHSEAKGSPQPPVRAEPPATSHDKDGSGMVTMVTIPVRDSLTR
jgi:hypothetical protein